MASRFRLMVGMHIGPDLTQEAKPVTNTLTGEPLKDKDGNVVTKYPSKTYRAGDVVMSNDDLVAKHGFQKFERLGGEFSTRSATGNPSPGDPSPDSVMLNHARAPHGQVSTGWPVALGEQFAPVTQGQLDPERVKKMQEELGEQQAQKEQEKRSREPASPAQGDPRRQVPPGREVESKEVQEQAQAPASAQKEQAPVTPAPTPSPRKHK